MAMEWFKFYPAMLDSIELQDLTEELGCPFGKAVSIYTQLMCWTAGLGTNGDVSGQRPAAIARACDCYRRTPRKLYDALVFVGLIDVDADGCARIHGWKEQQAEFKPRDEKRESPSERHRRLNRERQRRFYERQRRLEAEVETVKETMEAVLDNVAAIEGQLEQFAVKQKGQKKLVVGKEFFVPSGYENSETGVNVNDLLTNEKSSQKSEKPNAPQTPRTDIDIDIDIDKNKEKDTNNFLSPQPAAHSVIGKYPDEGARELLGAAHSVLRNYPDEGAKTAGNSENYVNRDSDEGVRKHEQNPEPKKDSPRQPAADTPLREGGKASPVLEKRGERKEERRPIWRINHSGNGSSMFTSDFEPPGRSSSGGSVGWFGGGPPKG
jgi:hypothetical protein